MRTVMVRYKTENAYAATNEGMIHAVFDELRARAPGGIRYTTYRLADGVTFIHVATIEGDSPLTGLASFKAFQERLAGNCVEPPVLVELSTVDGYASLP